MGLFLYFNDFFFKTILFLNLYAPVISFSVHFPHARAHKVCCCMCYFW